MLTSSYAGPIPGLSWFHSYIILGSPASLLNSAVIVQPSAVTPGRLELQQPRLPFEGVGLCTRPLHTQVVRVLLLSPHSIGRTWRGKNVQGSFHGFLRLPSPNILHMHYSNKALPSPPRFRRTLLFPRACWDGRRLPRHPPPPLFPPSPVRAGGRPRLRGCPVGSTYDAASLLRPLHPSRPSGGSEDVRSRPLGLPAASDALLSL